MSEPFQQRSYVAFAGRGVENNHRRHHPAFNDLNPIAANRRCNDTDGQRTNYVSGNDWTGSNPCQHPTNKFVQAIRARMQHETSRR
jgi:hypothetical protein